MAERTRPFLGISRAFRTGGVSGGCLWFLILGGTAGLLGCGNNGDGAQPAGPDTFPPAAVTDLRMSVPRPNSITLNWTAPGDDGFDGTATAYDLRFAIGPIDDSNWENATSVADMPAPQPGGTLERHTVEGLIPANLYYFAIRTEDDAGNRSELSNLLEAATAELPDLTPPGTVEDLAVVSTTATSITLTWSAPGDDGMTGSAFGYDIRYSTSPITEESFPSAEVVDPSPVPQPAGTTESWTIPDLEPDTAYSIALRAADEAINLSEISNVVEGVTGPSPGGSAHRR